MESSVVLAAVVGLGTFLFFLGLITISQRRHESVQRLEAYARPVFARTDEEPSGGLLGMVDRWINRRGYGAKISRMLAQADLKMTVGEYFVIHVALFVVGLALGPFVFGSQAGSLILAMLLLLAPQVYIMSAQQKRMRAFNEQLPAALDSVSNSLRGGYGLVQAMTLVSSELPPPMSTEFKRVVTEIGYGLSYDLAFKNMLRRNMSADLSMVVTAIEINLEVGGNLSVILDNIGSIIRDRVRIQGQIMAYTAMTRFSALVLTGLPFGLAAILFLVNRPYIMLLFTTSMGLTMLAIAGVMLAIGALILRKISKIDV